MILDVGCGSRPEGDVNIDLLLKGSDELPGTDRIVDPKNIPNLVKADAKYLPIKEKAFKTTICSHLLEHIDDEEYVLKELKRVTDGIVIIRVPYKWWETLATNLFSFKGWKKWRRRHHLRSYGMDNFKDLLRANFADFRVSYGFISLFWALRLKAKRNSKLPLPFPYEIRAEIRNK